MPEASTDLALVDHLAPTSGDIVVVASNPEQMQVAQARLIDHFKAKRSVIEAELAEANENLTHAKAHKWKHSSFQKIVSRLEKDVQFYDKISAALEAGYVIVPNFAELDVFAIRTTKRRPQGKIARGGCDWVQAPERQETNSPKLGEGRYVDADTANVTWTDTKRNKEGAVVSEIMVSRADAFRSIDFPFLLAKPEILARTSDAMRKLIFDDIGILPNRKKRRGDPMIIGRIMAGKREVSFLITWFVATNAI